MLDMCYFSIFSHFCCCSFLSSDPNTNYSFIVSGVTSNGIGPFSDPVNFSTSEGCLS